MLVFLFINLKFSNLLHSLIIHKVYLVVRILKKWTVNRSLAAVRITFFNNAYNAKYAYRKTSSNSWLNSMPAYAQSATKHKPTPSCSIRKTNPINTPSMTSFKKDSSWATRMLQPLSKSFRKTISQLSVSVVIICWLPLSICSSTRSMIFLTLCNNKSFICFKKISNGWPKWKSKKETCLSIALLVYPEVPHL